MIKIERSLRKRRPASQPKTRGLERVIDREERRGQEADKEKRENKETGSVKKQSCRRLGHDETTELRRKSGETMAEPAPAVAVVTEREERKEWWERKLDREGRVTGLVKQRERATVDERKRRSHFLDTKETAEEEDGGRRRKIS